MGDHVIFRWTVVVDGIIYIEPPALDKKLFFVTKIMKLNLDPHFTKYTAKEI